MVTTVQDAERRPLLSIVIPVYRSAGILPQTLAALDDYFAGHPHTHEVILVNDGSPDESWSVLERLQRGRDDVVAIDLFRNYGQHTALMCGLSQSTGEYVVTMDDDLQNPPEEVEKLLGKAREGHDVVFGAFERKMHGPVRRLGSWLIGWLNGRLFGKPPGLQLTNFRIIRREVVDAVCEVRTAFPYLPGLLLMTARRFANVPVVHRERAEGASNYTPRVILKLVLRIVFNYSPFPLRVLTGIGLFASTAAFAYGAFVLLRKLGGGVEVEGWTSIIVLTAFLHGVTLTILGALGEYLVRIRSDISRPVAWRVRTRLDPREDLE